MENFKRLKEEIDSLSIEQQEKWIRNLTTAERKEYKELITDLWKNPRLSERFKYDNFDNKFKDSLGFFSADEWLMKI